MDTLDNPVQLKFNNGNLTPENVKILAYIFIALSLFLLVFEAFIIGCILLIISIAVAFNTQITEIDLGQNLIHEYTLFIGFIKFGKKYQLSNYKYITGMPLIESTQMYSRTNNSTVISNNYTAVTIFKERLKGKLIISKCNNKFEADSIAKQFSDLLNLKYFEYDPQLVVKMLRGKEL